MNKCVPFGKIKNIRIGAFIVVFSAGFLLACSFSERIAEKGPSQPGVNPSASPGETSGPGAPGKIAGQYDVSGDGPGGRGYKGSLTVTERGEVYQFSWVVGPQNYEGVGVSIENTVAVAFTTGTDGSGCRVVHYKIAPNGDLNGRWGQWGVDNGGTEAASKISGSGLEGQYETQGTNLNGSGYRGSLSIAERGTGYDFAWDNNDKGFGIRSGAFVSVGIGGDKCGFAAYRSADGKLEGKWGMAGAGDISLETAVRK